MKINITMDKEMFFKLLSNSFPTFISHLSYFSFDDYVDTFAKEIHIANEDFMNYKALYLYTEPTHYKDFSFLVDKDIENKLNYGLLELIYKDLNL